MPQSARSQLVMAQTTEKRTHELYLAQGGSLKDWQQAQTDLITAQNTVRADEIALHAVRSTKSARLPRVMEPMPAPSLLAITVPPGTVPPTTVPPSSALTTDGGNHRLTAPTSVGAVVETSGGIDPVTVSAAAQVPGPALGLAAGGSAASSNPIPEPGSLGLLGVALLWFGWASRRPPSQAPASHDISLTGTGQDRTGLA